MMFMLIYGNKHNQFVIFLLIILIKMRETDAYAKTGKSVDSLCIL